MKQKKILFIVNPRSGKGQIKYQLLDIADVFIKGGLDVSLYITQEPQDAIRVVRERAQEFDLIACSGGDGTLDEVVTGMMDCTEKRPIGYIPAGSTNDFANSLQLPKHMKEAAQCIVEDIAYPCDVGSFNGDYFVYIAAFGIFTDVSYLTNQEMKNILGHLAYLLEGAKRIFNIKSYHVELEINDEHIEDDYIFGMITNSESVGGFRSITGRDIQLDDCLLEVTLIRMPRNPIELQDIISSLLRREMDSKYISTFKTGRIVLRSQTEIPWTLDGEFGGDHKEVEILCHQKAVPILVNHLPELEEGPSE